MQPRSLKITIRFNRGENGKVNSLTVHKPNSSNGEPNITNTSPPQRPSSSTELQNVRDEETEPENAQNQLVIYDPAIANSAQNKHQPPPSSRFPFSNQPSRVLPAVGAFTVQCANCFKWRLIPSKAKYEEIREHITEMPFVCETASEWRPDVSCDDPPDLMQDESRLWAIDKPNIAQPPPGWERLLRIRGEGSTKFADVYYVAPTGKRLRSMVEIQNYLEKHPEYAEEGVTLSQFSFQVPKPLQENYVRKRQYARPSPSCDAIDPKTPISVDPTKAITWVDDEEDTNFQPGSGPGLSTHIPEQENRPAKKKRTPSKQGLHGSLADNQKESSVDQSPQL